MFEKQRAAFVSNMQNGVHIGYTAHTFTLVQRKMITGIIPIGPSIVITVMAITMSYKHQWMGTGSRARCWAWCRRWYDAVVDLGISLSFASGDLIRGMSIAMEANQSIVTIVVVVAVTPTVLDSIIIREETLSCKKTTMMYAHVPSEEIQTVAYGRHQHTTMYL